MATDMKALLVLLSALPLPTDWYVDGQNPNCATGNGTAGSPFCTIAQAINAASGGDTIHIAPGTYRELLNVTKDLVFVGTQGQAVTFVDGGGGGVVVDVSSPANVVLDGLSIVDGSGSGTFSGIRASGGTLTLRNSTVTGHSIGVYSYGTAAAITVEDTTITQNSYTGVHYGNSVVVRRSTITNNGTSAVYGYQSTPLTIENSTLSNNGAYGTYWSGNVTISNSTIDGNGYGGVTHYTGNLILTNSTVNANGYQGVFSINDSTTIANSAVCRNRGYGGVYAYGSSANLQNVTLRGNSGYYVGAVANYSGTMTIDSSIVWGNTSTYGSPIQGTANVTYSNVQGGFAGNGNTNVDPLFASTSQTSVAITSASPMIDQGDPTSTPTGKDVLGFPRFLDGDLDLVQRVDMGAHEYDNAQLTITGSATRGGTLTLTLDGRAGLPFVRLFSLRESEFALPPFGALFVDLTSTWTVVQSGVVPDRVAVTIPANVFVPAPMVLQDLVIDPINLSGNLSNPVSLVVR
ncbi:MAG: right-handed parallel beta-helix repeat-containing protein [Planctomycetes bacterium]|nr:right-handed parallel beta-helix repeat-containing protein [Planctomycetota bacterium]